MTRRWLNATTLDAVGLFVGLLALYLANGAVFIGGDSVSNSYLPLSVLNQGNLSYTPDEFPFMFGWQFHPSGREQEPLLLAIADRSPRVEELRAEGLLQVRRENYFLVPSTRLGLYVNTFGPGAGLTALPAAAVVQLIAGDLMQRTWLLALICRLVAAGCVAASAVLVYLTARRFVTRGQSLLLTLAYGLGTCVWAISSQSLTQHSPNEFYLALGTYLLARSGNSWRWLLWAGAAYSAAAVCRPTSGVALLAVGVYLLIVNRRGWLAFTAGALPLLGLLAAYNAYYLGSPLTFGQTVQARLYLMREFGSTYAWRTPLLTGLAGILFSPSRGLFIFSPWLAIAGVGMAVVWRRSEYSWLRPLTVAMALILALQSKWFDWWGGWCYGYRPIVDLMPMFSLCAMPVLPWLCRRWLLSVAWGALLAWSIFVQALGAWAYDVEGWNTRRGFAVRIPGREDPVYTTSADEAARLAAASGAQVEPASLNIDHAPHTQRLWSLSDNQIGYYIAHFSAARKARQTSLAEGHWVAGPNPALTHFGLAALDAQLGRVDSAIAEYQAAIEAAPSFQAAWTNLGNLYAQQGRFGEAEAAYRAAAEFDRPSMLAYENLGRMLAERGAYQEAVAEYERALGVNPFSLQTRFLLAEALAQLGDGVRAKSEYDEVLRRAPRFHPARLGLGWLLATSADAGVRDPQRAWNELTPLLEQTRGRDPRVLDAAAAAAAALGHFDDAVRMAEQARALLRLRASTVGMTAAEAEAETKLAAEIADRIELYRRREAYLETIPPTGAQ